MRTKNGLPKHCGWNIDRKAGQRRVRFRKGKVSVYLTGTPWSEDFMRQYAAALDRAQPAGAEIGAARTKPGSVNALIVSYYKLVFPTLAASTQAVRRNILERFRTTPAPISGQLYGDKSVAGLTHEVVNTIIVAKAAVPHSANSLRKVLRHMLDHAVDINMIKINPALRTKRLKTASGGLHTWTDAEIAGYRDYWPLGTQMRLAMELALETTSRRADVTRIGPQHERPPTKEPDAPNGWLDLRHTKNDSRTFIPISDELRAAIDACPVEHLTFLHTRSGKPRSAKALGGDFRKWCDAAGLPKHCTIHGLRKGNLRRHADAGATTKELQALGGHKSLSALQPYIEDSNRADLAVQAMAKLKRATQRRASENKKLKKLSSMPTRSVQQR